MPFQAGSRDAGAVQGVAIGLSAAIGPVEQAPFLVDFEIDGFRKRVHEQLDVGPVPGLLTLGKLNAGAEDTAETCFLGPLLGPVELAVRGIERDADTLVELVAGIGASPAPLHQRFQPAPVDPAAHDPAAFAVAPVEHAGVMIQLELLGRVDRAVADQLGIASAVEAAAPDGAVRLEEVLAFAMGAHVGPVEITFCRIDLDTVGVADILHRQEDLAALTLNHHQLPLVDIQQGQTALRSRVFVHLTSPIATDPASSGGRRGSQRASHSALPEPRGTSGVA